MYPYLAVYFGCVRLLMYEQNKVFKDIGESDFDAILGMYDCYGSDVCLVHLDSAGTRDFVYGDGVHVRDRSC